MSEPGTQGQPDEAMIDLLIKQVTEGLSPAEQRALDVMDGAVASELLRDLERVAAAITLAGSSTAAGLPAALAQRLTSDAEAHFAGTPAVRTTVADLNSMRVPPAQPPRAALRSGTYGWLAAAACLLIALFSWVRTPPPAPVAQVMPTPAAVVPPTLVVPPAPPVPPTPAEERSALMANNDTQKIVLAATKDPAAAGVTGDVVWDPASQRGYVHFAGLPANDPTMRQYQIWIFDGGRDKRYPVDGGVFDVPANAGEVVIPIRATLMVLKPAAFAVTLEKPGGVVVSKREHVLALGAAG